MSFEGWQKSNNDAGYPVFEKKPAAAPYKSESRIVDHQIERETAQEIKRRKGLRTALSALSITLSYAAWDHASSDAEITPEDLEHKHVGTSAASAPIKNPKQTEDMSAAEVQPAVAATLAQLQQKPPVTENTTPTPIESASKVKKEHGTRGEFETDWENNSEQFKQRVSGYEAWWTLPAGHYQAVDQATGAPVGQPIAPERYLVDKRDKRTPMESQYDPNAYWLEPAEFKNWKPFVFALNASKWGVDPSSLGQLNNNADFRAALANDKEPELVAGVRAGAIESTLDIVGYFGMNPDRTVPGDPENRTYAQYVLDELPKHLDIPDPLVKAEIMKYALGLIAKESKFNDGMDKNFATAWGALQLTDDVRKEHLFTYDDNLSEEENERLRQKVINRKLTFGEQVEIAGKHFCNIYQRVPHWIDNGYKDGKTYDRSGDVQAELKAVYASEEDWKRYGLVPWMINAYNGGSLLMGDSIEAYIKMKGESFQADWNGVAGYDLYYDMSKFAYRSKDGRMSDYGDDSVQYVPMTFAATHAIAREFPELTDPDQIEMTGSSENF